MSIAFYRYYYKAILSNISMYIHHQLIYICTLFMNMRHKTAGCLITFFDVNHQCKVFTNEAAANKQKLPLRSTAASFDRQRSLSSHPVCVVECRLMMVTFVQLGGVKMNVSCCCCRMIIVSLAA